jgi:hypothetical protein
MSHLLTRAVSTAPKPFAQLTKDTGVGHLFRNHELSFALSAKTLLSAFHRSIARRYGHGTEHDTGVAALAEFRTHPKWEIHPSVLASTNKANGIRLPHLGTDANAPTAQNTFFVPEGVSDFLDSTAHGDVLNGPRVWRLSNQQFRNVSSQGPYLFTVASNRHPFFHMKGARSSDG